MKKSQEAGQLRGQGCVLLMILLGGNVQSSLTSWTWRQIIAGGCWWNVLETGIPCVDIEMEDTKILRCDTQCSRYHFFSIENACKDHRFPKQGVYQYPKVSDTATLIFEKVTKAELAAMVPQHRARLSVVPVNHTLMKDVLSGSGHVSKHISR